MLTLLVLPLASAAALFVASFLSWMVLKLHFTDWVKIENEDEIIGKVRDLGLPAGNYAFPGFATPEDTTNPEIHAKCAEGPSGLLTVFPPVSMGRNLGLTFLYFLVVSFCLAYLTGFALGPDASRFEVFRFVATAGLMTFLSAMRATRDLVLLPGRRAHHRVDRICPDHGRNLRGTLADSGERFLIHFVVRPICVDGSLRS